MSLSEDSSELGGKAEASSQLWKIILVQFFYWLGLSFTLTNYPLVWTTTTIAHGDAVLGGTLHAGAVFLNAGCEFLSASFLGVLSDRYGRKYFLYLGCLGQIIDFTVGAFATSNRFGDEGTWGIAMLERHKWLFAARLVAGLLGNVQIFTKSYVADISDAANSSRNFGLLSACVGGALIIGVPLGSRLADWIGLRVTMLIAAALNLMNLIIIFFLQESLLADKRKKFELRKANPVGGICFLLSTRFLTLFGSMAFLDQFALQLLSTVLIPYADAVYDIRGLTVSLVILLFALTQAVTLLTVLRPLLLRKGELFVLKLGYSLSCVAFTAFALSSYSRVFALNYPCALLLALGQISAPTQTGISIRCVMENEQGTLQAANGSVDVVGKMASAAIVALTFKPLVNIGQPGVIWWIGAGVLLCGVWIAFNLEKHLPVAFQDICNCDDSGNHEASSGSSSDTEEEESSDL